MEVHAPLVSEEADAVWQMTPLRTKPVPQLSQITAVWDVHLDPVAAVPCGQVQVLASRT
jgi:hypothetical protein